MAEIRIASYPAGLRTPANLEVSFGLPFNTGEQASFAIDWIDGDGNVAFHFNPRPEEDVVVLNNCIAGNWGTEVRVRGCPFSREPDASHVKFSVDDDGFLVIVDGQEFCEFEHRSPPSDITEVQSWRDLWLLHPRAHLLRRLGRRKGSATLPAVVPTAYKWEGHAWVDAEDNPAQPVPVKLFRFFAVLGTWNEEDVAAAAVASAVAQGCERVYLVDNGSADGTVEAALAAGAVLARSFESERYQELERIAQMQAVVDEVSAAEGADHVWWLWLDADEFHHGPAGSTLRQYLATLDRRFRIVGTRYFNHFPNGTPEYVEARHPLDFQPLCYELNMSWYCDRGHWKHLLQRWDRDGTALACYRGFHRVTNSEPLLEPTVPVFSHHFPYRSRGLTERRLVQLFGEAATTACGAGRAGRSEANQDLHMRMRYRSLDAVYRRRWEDVRFFPPCAKGYVPELKPFQDWVGVADAQVARWY